MRFTEDKKLRVLIADGHPATREGLRWLINQQPDMRVEGEGRDGAEAFAMASPDRFDLVMLAIEMPKLNGIDCLMNIRTKSPGLFVLVLSEHPESRYAVRMLKSGANGYISKSADVDEIVKAIRRVANGYQYISGELTSRLTTTLDQSGMASHNHLSLREYQIFHKLARGLRHKEIAAELSLSKKTVSTYRQRVLTKMKLKSNAELTRYAVENKLVE